MHFLLRYVVFIRHHDICSKRTDKSSGWYFFCSTCLNGVHEGLSKIGQELILTSWRFHTVIQPFPIRCSRKATLSNSSCEQNAPCVGRWKRVCMPWHASLPRRCAMLRRRAGAELTQQGLRDAGRGSGGGWAAAATTSVLALRRGARPCTRGAKPPHACYTPRSCGCKTRGGLEGPGAGAKCASEAER